MAKASILALLGALSLLSHAAATTKPKPRTAVAVKRTVSKSKNKAALSGRGTKSSARQVVARKSGRAGASRVVATRLVRTKSGRLTRVAVYAAPAPTYQTHPDSDRYIEIQKALADRGYFKGEPNGTWGDDSSDALRRFQAGSNLPDDGKISALSLTGLGLGPRHDGSTASTVPLSAIGTEVLPAPASSTPGSAVSPAVSAPVAPPPPRL